MIVPLENNLSVNQLTILHKFILYVSVHQVFV